jgi:S-adenosylmethionine-dependent carboxyl methyltransferase
MNGDNETGPAADLSGVMRRGGFYNLHSSPQHDAASPALALLSQAAEIAPLPDRGAPLVIADYGAAQGGNSLAPMRIAINAIRRRLPGAASISVVHTDIPRDDFSALFSLLETSPDSYLRDAANVFPFAAGRSFYRQIFPADAVLLGWSAIAVHWLSAAPAQIAAHIWSPRADPATLALFAWRSARDWADFLSHRAVEMRPGGRLVVIGGAADESGDSGADGLMDMANAALQALVADRTLSASEYRRMTIPTYNRTPAEFLAPFAGGRSQGGLRVEHQELRTLEDPLWAEYQRTKELDAFVAAYVDFFDAAFAPSVFSALAPNRPAARRLRIHQQFSAKLASLIAENPPAAVCRWRTFTMVIAKE